MNAEPISLQIGAGKKAMAGWVNQDMFPAPGIDLTFDLMGAWPLKDNSVKEVYCSHVLEHLPDPRHFFRELWRVCRPNASVIIRVPYGSCDLAMSDVTHLRPWFATSFCFLQPGYAEELGNAQHDEMMPYPFGIEIIQLRLAAFFARRLRRWYWRVLLYEWLPYFWNAVEEMHAYLYALKSPDAVAEYCTRHPNVHVMYANHVAWKHQVYGEDPLSLEGDGGVLINIADGSLARSATYRL